jgi:hypothetical protein
VPLDRTSGIVVGAGTEQGGVVAVGSGATLSSDSGVLSGNVMLDGVLVITPADVNAAANDDFDVTGAIGGDGMIVAAGNVTIDLGADNDISGLPSFTGTVGRDAGNTLSIAGGSDLSTMPIVPVDGAVTSDLLGQAYTAGNIHYSTLGPLAVGDGSFFTTLDVGSGLRSYGDDGEV